MGIIRFENDLKGRTWKFWVGAVIFLGIFYFIISSFISPSSPSGTATETPSSSNSSNFGSLSRTRFDNILSASPELRSITCEGACDTVVYFDYITLPDDLEFVIRGNAATFSKFKLEHTGVSHVSVIARYGGVEVMSCRAAGGIVSECRK